MYNKRNLSEILHKNLRAISNQPVHLIRNTNAEHFTELQIQPTQMLQKEMVQRHDKATVVYQSSDLDIERVRQWREIVLSQLVSHQQTAGVRNAHNPSVQVGPAGNPADAVRLVEITQAIAQACVCPECGLGHANHLGLATHRRKQHGVVPEQEQTDTKQYPVEHAVDGLPKCRHCLKELTTWPCFAVHIAQCPVLKMGKGADIGSGALTEDAEAQTVLAEQGWRGLTKDPPIDKMRNHCALCNLWASSFDRVKTHIRCKHPEYVAVAEHVNAACQSLSGTVGRPRTVPFTTRLRPHQDMQLHVACSDKVCS